MEQASGAEAVISIDPSEYFDDGLPFDSEMFEDDVIPVDPSGFDEDAWMAWLAAEYSRVPSPAERVERVISIRAGMARLAAMEARELAALADDIDAGTTSGNTTGTTDLEYRSLVAELAVAVRVSDRTMAARLDEAMTLARKFPATPELSTSSAPTSRRSWC